MLTLEALDAAQQAVTVADLVVGLNAAVAGRQAADEWLDAAVIAARRGRVSWARIGAAIGLTRQGARQRYAPLVE